MRSNTDSTSALIAKARAILLRQEAPCREAWNAVYVAEDMLEGRAAVVNPLRVRLELMRVIQAQAGN